MTVHINKENKREILDLESTKPIIYKKILSQETHKFNNQCSR